MGEVLGFFAFLFAIFRLCVRIGADGHGRRMERRVGTAQEYVDKWCDEELEKELRDKLRLKEYYESTWQTLEHTWETRRAEIDNGPERPKQVWHAMMEGGRKPFNMYDRDFLRQQGYNFWVLQPYDSAYKSLKFHCCEMMLIRAVYCLMWIQGKKPHDEALNEYRLLYGIKPKYDVLTDPDCGTKNDQFLKDKNIPW